MYNGYKVVVVTPAGRRRYLELLRAHLERAAVVDRWDLWINTTDAADLAYLQSLGERYWINLHRGTEPELGIRAIAGFYRHSIAQDTIYVRLDDDVVWLAPDFFAQILAARLAYSEPLLVSAAVVNNVLCDYLRQRSGVLRWKTGLLTYACMCPLGWRNGEFAEHRHRRFLSAIRAGATDRWRTQDWELYQRERLSINAVAYFGADMAAIVRAGDLIAGVDEESWLTTRFPSHTGRMNRICGTALAAHFAFGPQRRHLDGTDVLEEYRKCLR